MPAAALERSFDRFIVIVLDSVGCGDAPDAADFGDAGANTLARVINVARPSLPHLAGLGLDRIDGVPCLRADHDAGVGLLRAGDGVSSAPADDVPTPLACWGRMTEQSRAKDTMSGHWELMCVFSEVAFPVYPDGFPDEIMRAFERSIGRSTLGNVAASGTEIIDELGEQHMRSGAPIIYTSADSVFQVAAHEEVIPVAELYKICEAARRLLVGENGVARVIARPFVGTPADGFRRTPRRRDLALPPPGATVLERLTDAGFRTFAVGKIHDIFSGRGLSDWVKTVDNADGVDKTIAAISADAGELVFTNLVDFDSDYGHRRDIEGYARALEEFDARVPDLLAALRPRDCLVITADHGNDPGYRGSDHTRERVPLLVYTGAVAADLGTRTSFADVGRTVLENFGLRGGAGTSFLDLVT